MATILVICKTCTAQASVPNSTSKHRCSKCNDVTNTTRRTQSTTDHGFSLRKLDPTKIIKDHRTLKSPYADSLNNVQCPTTAGFVPGNRSNKRALLCGVTYNSKKYRLRGTVNDVMNMKDFLIYKFGFPKESIRVLTEYEEGEFIPTKINIQKSLKWLVNECKPGDSLVFYFSGHGLRQPDFNDDEVDGFDETICPVDFMEKGMILDNDINNDIVRPLKQGVTLHAIIDACHSGTVLDLTHIYNHESGTWKDNKPPSGVAKGTNGGLAICLSACQDDEMAADTSALTNGKAMNGVLTHVLIQTVKQNGEIITYENLLKKMIETIHKINKDRCLTSNILNKIFRRKIIPEPLLSSSEVFDVKTKKFIF